MNRLILLSLTMAILCACSTSVAQEEPKADEGRIETGVQLVRALAVIQKHYKAGLNDAALITYFNDPANAEKFKTYWDKIVVVWFSPRITPCREFANWEQLANDRVWVIVADAYVQGNIGESLDEQQAALLFGTGWNELSQMKKDGSLQMPSTPRTLDAGVLEKHKALFDRLFRRYALDSSKDTAGSLCTAIFAELNEKLLHAPTGLRKKILMEYKKDFVAELDELREASGMIEYMLLEFGEEALFGFRSTELLLCNSLPEARNLKVKYDRVPREVSNIEVGIRATVNDTPAYSFILNIGPMESVRVWLKAP